MQASLRIRLPECICDAPDMHKESGAAPQGGAAFYGMLRLIWTFSDT